VDYLSKHRDDSGIIYALSRNSTESLAADLSADGFSALPYHAGLENDIRKKHQEMFLRDETKIIVATIAFGMGINKSNVRFVIHVDLPKNIESYYQETGRAGRDGLKSDALLFYSGGDVIKLKKFAVIEDNPEQTNIMLRKLQQMADLCETPSCRRQRILNYFGEDHPGDCASCDACLTQFERMDGTTIAQKALSAVARLEGKYGLTYTIDFLRGSKSEKMKDYHRTLPTYGVGSDISKEDWYRYFKELIGQGYLQQTGDEYPVIKLTALSPGVLKGETKVSLIKTIEKREGIDSNQYLPYEQELFTNLKQIRATLATKENMPAYIILSDATLLELATYLPLNLIELRKISGFGDVKVARYGNQFLPAIVDYCRTHRLSSKIDQKIPKRERKSNGVGAHGRAPKTTDTKLESLRLFQAGKKSIEQIAALRQLGQGTIEGHLAHFIPTGEIKITDIVPAEKIPMITEAVKRHGGYAASPIKMELGDAVSYGEIRAVMAHLLKK
ncbi:MAG TPA: RecQ family ATP-dependent DNA helicase, partial [Patescibacteria group bacterium]|nr:RecQ family ATP-dependent DNA helicase [Patescibacteria group bacterium]